MGKVNITTGSAWEYYKVFLTWDIERQNRELIERPPEFWEDIGRQKALEVFHAAAKRVPAYKKFLRKHKINPGNIKTLEDFKSVPTVAKKNYLKAYPLAELCWDGDLSKMDVISVSSGTSGSPFLWPREIWQEREVDHFYELTLRYLFEAEKKHTLIVVAFAMGMYIAGPFTFASCLRIAQKGYPIAITSPSSDIEAVVSVVENLGHHFDQVLIGGYPPLVKEIIDVGVKRGLNWGKLNTRLFFGGEGFSEKWRDYVQASLETKSVLTSTINMYGTADSALLGIESPVSIAFRRAVSTDRELVLSTFESERLPSIVTYNPLLKYFEVDANHSLLFTASSGIPLIRYHIGDVGGIIPYSAVAKVLNGKGVQHSLDQDSKGLPHWKLPLVYLFGRDDFTVQLYGANIYPENIKEALEDERISRMVTGKFILGVNYRRNMSQFLDIRVELAEKVQPDRVINAVVKSVIVETLRSKNSEYGSTYNAIKKKAEPRINLEAYGGKDFKIKIKHPWLHQKIGLKTSKDHGVK